MAPVSIPASSKKTKSKTRADPMWTQAFFQVHDGVLQEHHAALQLPSFNRRPFMLVLRSLPWQSNAISSEHSLLDWLLQMKKSDMTDSESTDVSALSTARPASDLRKEVPSTMTIERSSNPCSAMIPVVLEPVKWTVSVHTYIQKP